MCTFIWRLASVWSLKDILHSLARFRIDRPVCSAQCKATLQNMWRYKMHQYNVNVHWIHKIFDIYNSSYKFCFHPNPHNTHTYATFSEKNTNVLYSIWININIKWNVGLFMTILSHLTHAFSCFKLVLTFSLFKYFECPYITITLLVML